MKKNLDETLVPCIIKELSDDEVKKKLSFF